MTIPSSKRHLGAAALAATIASAWIAPALAQPAAPPAPPAAGAPGPQGGPQGGPGFGPPGGPGWHHHMRGPGGDPFGGPLLRREDKQLTAAEVQKIAEAFLLWHGERNWRITQVREAANNTVEFALTTAENSVIARFSMDRKTGRVQRVG